VTEHATTEDRRGTITAEGDGRLRLEFRRAWPDPIDDVWSALTDPERLARWIGRYEGERTVGARGTFFMTHEEGEQTGEPATIVECDPPRRLVVLTEVPGQDPWQMELDLAEQDGRTVLRFRQFFPAGTDVADIAGGWHWYLDKLDAEVSGRPAPSDWETFWAEVGPGYRPA
jgi:uncharacterized protein YndB with AHSA1/START domain